MRVERRTKGDYRSQDGRENHRGVPEDHGKHEPEKERVHHGIIVRSRCLSVREQGKHPADCQPEVSGQQADRNKSRQSLPSHRATCDVVAHQPKREPDHADAGHVDSGAPRGRRPDDPDEQEPEREDEDDPGDLRQLLQSCQFEPFPGDREQQESHPPGDDLMNRKAEQPEYITRQLEQSAKPHGGRKQRRLTSDEHEEDDHQRKAARHDQCLPDRRAHADDQAYAAEPGEQRRCVGPATA